MEQILVRGVEQLAIKSDHTTPRYTTEHHVTPHHITPHQIMAEHMRDIGPSSRRVFACDRMQEASVVLL
jgi:hypothetical protein